MNITIDISKDYAKAPGGRHESEGPCSGENFRKTLLLPKYEEAIKNGCKLTVILDGGYGYAPSFLEESFGGLARETKDKKLQDVIEIISQEEPKLIDDINEYIADALGVN